MFSKFIPFCYAYMIGIALAMRWPLAGNYFVPGLVVVAVLAIATAIFSWLRRRPRLALVLLLLCGTGIGYLRHAAINRRPERHLATIVACAGETAASLSQPIELPEAARLRLAKASPGGARLRLTGSLRALVPVLDDAGTPAMDNQARWRFTEEIRSGLVTECLIAAELPPGAQIELDSPFSSIEKVEVLEQTGEKLELRVVRVSSHVSSFTRPGRGNPPVTILGRIADDPTVYPHQTVLNVAPAYIQTTPGGTFLRVSGGQVRVSARPTLPGYGSIARTEACGNDVVVQGELQTPQGAAIDGGFDYRRYLANYGLHGQISLWTPRRGDSSLPLRIVAPDGLPPRNSSSIIMFSLRLRDKMLRVLKQTLPYPHSAFAGGVTLGLRYGLQNTECLLSPDTPQSGLELLRATHAPCADFIAEEFRRSGVNHVLAVSGLHVTIITVMLVGIFTVLRLSRRAYVPVILLALVVFAIITGARPSTLRAVIMNGLFLLSWAYLDRGLRSSILIGAPVAAFLILLQNPSILIDPSFSLSFGAIYSLALLTGPCHTLLSRFRGNDLLVLGIVIIAAHVIMARDWMYLTAPFSVTLLLALTLALFAAGRRLAERGFTPIGEYGFADLPTGINGFIAAQFAIQIGMMIPLSSYYFARWPVAGAAANIIAIPLIGVVLQLAMLSCLAGLIPGIGIYIALILNGANWLFSGFFMLIAHYAGKWLPYPFIKKPTPFGLAVYFSLVGLFVAWPRLGLWLARQDWWRDRKAVRRTALALCLLLAFVALPRAPRPDGRTHVTIMPVNYGSSIIVRSPTGRTVLIDGGYAIRDRNRAVEAERNILPYLCRLGIRELDAVIALSARPERLAGVAHVLKHCSVGQLVLPPGLADMFDEDNQLDLSKVNAVFGPLHHPTEIEARETIAGRDTAIPHLALADVLADRRVSFANRLTGRAIRIVAGQPGMKIYPESTANGDFAIEVIGPTLPDAASRILDNGSLAIRLHHGDFGTLLTGDLDYDAVAHLLDTHAPEALSAQVLIAPTRGTWKPAGVWRTDSRFAPLLRAKLEDTVGSLLQTAGVREVIFEYGLPRAVLKDSRDAERAHEVARAWYEERLAPDSVYSTQAEGTIMLVSDGCGYQLETLRRSDAAEDDIAVTTAAGDVLMP